MLKVLTTGRLGAQFSASLESSELPIQVKFVDNAQQVDVDWADCLASFPVSEQLSLKNIPWIHSFGAGLDGFLQRKDLNPTVRLSRTTGRLAQKMGEFCLCYLLSFLHNTAALQQHRREKNWQPKPTKSIRGQVVLLLGTGKMAQGVAQLLAPLGVTTIGVNNSGRAPDTHFSQCVTMTAVPKIANKVDCIINTLPLHKQTERLLDLSWFSHFHDALFINVGRGGSVLTDDLQLAFQRHHLAYAVLDVFDIEPLPQDSWLWQHPQVFVSPHQAAVTDIDDVMMSFTEALQAHERGLDSEFFTDLSKGY